MQKTPTATPPYAIRRPAAVIEGEVTWWPPDSAAGYASVEDLCALPEITLSVDAGESDGKQAWLKIDHGDGVIYCRSGDLEADSEGFVSWRFTGPVYAFAPRMGAWTLVPQKLEHRAGFTVEVLARANALGMAAPYDVPPRSSGFRVARGRRPPHGRRLDTPLRRFPLSVTTEPRGRNATMSPAELHAYERLGLTDEEIATVVGLRDGTAVAKFRQRHAQVRVAKSTRPRTPEAQQERQELIMRLSQR